jgi:hypothetical protein
MVVTTASTIQAITRAGIHQGMPSRYQGGWGIEGQNVIVRNMSEYQITYWRDIPSMVMAREGDETARAQLEQRFQEAIDEAAMRLGESDADAYMEGWRKGDWTAAEGAPADVADRVVKELEAELSAERLTALLDELGPALEA